MSNLGRNDPCPCGSGKKYKKCCMSKHNVAFGEQLAASKSTKQHDDFIPIEGVVDYGQSLLDETFFVNNNVHEISAPRLIYSCLLYPEIEGIASKVVRQAISRYPRAYARGTCSGRLFLFI
jgi:hypothetical protein